MLENLAAYRIILGSNSPRRRELLAGLDLSFDVHVIPGLEENYPDSLQPQEIPVFLSKQKAEAYLSTLEDQVLLITADTIVWNETEVIGKPKDREDAIRMLRSLSGHEHQVVTGVCLTTTKKQETFSVVSSVRFASLTDEEIIYYVDKYKPFDKAGAYGIQEWIGYVGVESISGSFYNVMGLPVQRLYQELKRFV
ncbi:MAG: Maf-like protein [Parabacteroides sp.]|uniref:dTTP/UTP pyrophosphatase n=1 Tax=Parabacteroides faecalis TaxID=2924040 RepID=A0ABT0C0H2_9BACT|nr:Maf-like protein [Parabacteroides faecalis]MCI7286150.1 Maf-like protein [Parabacteroides sp.]MDY5623744.1 Maf-like protein [Bacteroidales bacterium]CDE61485.1 maf-like protein PRABACTJOHN_00927 [Parabacteroides sp. CAG:409]HIX21263.1 septum formation protein Maf [Candidatus Parabacteroides faecavium]MCI7357066.1 Maf-like protein [Parabacteroides sp.]